MTSSDARETVMQKKFVPCTGMTVEVTTNEEGFNSAWYTATTVNTPKGKEKKVLIEYHNLVTDDGSKPLREYARRSLVRPLPPSDIADSSNNSPRFKEEDVVDTFYNDGWWTGVVCRVLEDEKFLVYFQDPPDVMLFELPNLRMHQDWVKGKWVPSKRHSKQLPTKSVFSTGQAVEVNLDDKTFGDMWFTAIFIEESQGKFLVKYKSPRGGDEFGFIKVMADSLHIRPIPPPCVVNVDRNYELLERVEVVHEFGWRVGEIKTVTADRTYEVFFPSSQEESAQFDHLSIRPYMCWVAGKWTTKFEDAKYQHEEVSSNNKKRGSNSNITSPEAGASSHVKSKKPRLPSGNKADPHAETPKSEAPQESFFANDTRNNESLPFDKCSPIWETVESLEVFKRMPQKPHFLPLTHSKEECREGKAVAMMLTFSCVSEKVAMLKYDDPRGSFSSVLETLLDLEKYGFDVSRLRDRVLKVLGLKNRLSQLQEEARVSETRLTELTQVNKIKSDEAEEIKKEITVLQERLLQVEAEVGEVLR